MKTSLQIPHFIYLIQLHVGFSPAAFQTSVSTKISTWHSKIVVAMHDSLPAFSRFWCARDCWLIKESQGWRLEEHRYHFESNPIGLKLVKIFQTSGHSWRRLTTALGPIMRKETVALAWDLVLSVLRKIAATGTNEFAGICKIALITKIRISSSPCFHSFPSNTTEFACTIQLLSLRSSWFAKSCSTYYLHRFDWSN